jgi:hypothetical protein
LAAATFAIGLGVGATIGPVTASRNGSETPVAAPAIATAPSSETNIPRMAHPAEVVRVIDGDTFEARVHLWPGLDITTRVRLRGIDAPEFKARCTEERIRAEAARDALRAILDQGEVGISRVTLGKYVAASSLTHRREQRRMFHRGCSASARPAVIKVGTATAGAPESLVWHGALSE